MAEIDWRPDKRNSIGSSTGRVVYDGARTAQVRTNATSKAQMTALLDLLDLHLSHAEAGAIVDRDRVVLRVPRLIPEARGALGTLIDALVAPVRVQVMESTAVDAWAPAATGWAAEDATEYAGWPALLARPRTAPVLVTSIVEQADLPELRAYPMLSTAGGWSIRLEGLEVAQANARQARLGVGKDGRTGARSTQRRAWIKATGLTTALSTEDAAEAAQLIRDFAPVWRGLGGMSRQHDEHALESRILRGATPIEVAGRPLALIDPDPVVSWGSQFPTKWGRGGPTRYLDALLRDGPVPWAIEMKVQGGAGVGQYYRHAVAQAVLYREFIRRATPLHAWFRARGLEAALCEAAVVVPRLSHPRHVPWRDHIARLCDAFAVTLVEVDPRHALRHAPGLSVVTPTVESDDD